MYFLTASDNEELEEYASLKKSGITDDLVRLSIGIENVDDIIDDLTQALDAVFGKKKKK